MTADAPEKFTLQQAAQITGVAYQLLKKHAQRGKIQTITEGGRVMVTQEAIDAYQMTEGVGKAADEAEGRPLSEGAQEIGNAINRLPHNVRAAILDGIPSGKKTGGPESFRKATEGMPKHHVVVHEEDPHYGFPIGHRHGAAPRWRRSSETTWVLNGGTWSWNGMFWEGGGVREGSQLGEGISPGHPDSALRPLAPPSKAPTGEASRS